MKIIVSTFNNSKNNYGALFQSCALSAFLNNLNYDVSYVTIESRPKLRISRINSAKLILKSILNLPHNRSVKRREKKFKQFASETQNQLIFSHEKDLYDNPPKADVYISGSDQVWNPVTIHDDLFLSYAPENAKKIAYAASMGNEHLPTANEEKFSGYIKRYDCISVREDTIIDLIGKYTTKEVHQNIDPVFLLSKNDWIKLEKSYEKIRFPRYILAYIIEWNSDFNKQLSDLKKKTGMPVVSVSIGNIKKICADQIIYDASPNEFLYLLDRADIVVTTSFHGTALAIVYNKPFVALVGKDKPTRIESLLRHFCLSHSVDAESKKINYDDVNEIIIKDRQIAKAYLTNAIEK